MKVVHKVKVPISNSRILSIKGFNGFLKIGEQDGELFIWYLVNLDDSSSHSCEIIILGTGRLSEEINKVNKGSYFDSIQMSNGLDLHVFIP